MVSFDEVVSQCGHPTHYEAEHGISVISKEVRRLNETTALVLCYKSDGQTGINICFRWSKKDVNSWKHMMPLKDFFDALPEIKAVYDEVNSLNCDIALLNRREGVKK